MATTQVVPIEGIDKYGFIADSPSIALPPGAFSDVLNVRFDNGAVRKVKGYTEVFDALNLTNIIKIAYWPNPNRSVWIVVNREGSVGSEKDHIYGVYLNASGTIVSTDLSLNSSTGYNTSDNWQVSLFNGGYSIILNPGNGTPQHSTDTQGTSVPPDFADLPNWASYTVDGTTATAVYAGIVIAFGNLLLAGDLAEYNSGGAIIRDLRGVVRSSSVAAPGTIPQNWNPFATGSGTADELIIADTGQIKAMKPLQGKVMVYTSDSISQLSVSATGLSEIKVTNQYGAINQESVYEYDGKHIVLGSNDIYSFSGHPASIQSIADGRVRRYYYDDVHGSSTTLTRIVRDLTYDELWICYRSNNNTTETLDIALTWNYRQNVWSKRSLPNLKDIVVGAVTGGGVDTQKYTFAGNNTGAATSGTPEVQQITISGATLGGGTKEIQSGSYSGTRSNVVGTQNEIYTLDLGTINTGTATPIPNGSSFVTSKSVAAPAYGTTSTNFGGVTGLTIAAPAQASNIRYTTIQGNGGSPSVGTRTINSGSFSYTWHNRTFSGDQNSWGTSMVRETDNQVQYCKTDQVYRGRLGWGWTAGLSGYTQNPYYFTIKVVGKHRTSATGLFLTGTNYYTLEITRNQSVQGSALATRHTVNPGNPNGSSNGSNGNNVESNIAYLYDFHDCTIEFYFNSNLPGTSSASFAFYWANDTNGYDVTNNTSGNIMVENANLNPGNQNIPVTVNGNIDLSAGTATTFDLDLDANNQGTFSGSITGAFSANISSTDAAEELRLAIIAKGYSGVFATRAGDVVTIDTGQQSNLSGSYAVSLGTGASGGSYSLTQQNGFNNPTFATTYTINAPDGTQVTSFTGSTATTGASDLSTVLSAIQTAIQNYTDLSTSIDNSTVTTSSPNIVITNGLGRVVSGTWSVTVNNNGVTGVSAGNISIGNFSQTTAGVDGASLTGTATLGSTNYSYTAINALTVTSTNNQMVGYLATALNNVISDWTVTASGANLVFTDTISRNITDTFSLTVASSDSSNPSAGSSSVTTQGVDLTTAGSIVSVITPTSGSTVTLSTTLSNKTPAQCATELAADLNARSEFTATASGAVVSVVFTQFGNAAPRLDVTFDPGTVLSGNAAVAPTNTAMVFNTEDTRDLERPWPTTFINENFNFLVGTTSDKLYAFDIGYDADDSNLEAYVERKNIHVSPTKDVENYTAFFLDTEGENGSFDIKIEMTNAAGQTADLSASSTSATSYSFIFGGDEAQHEFDTRLSGRIANYRIQNTSIQPWSIAALGFEFHKGGIK